MSAEPPGDLPSKPTRSGVEVQKENSRFLRGTIGDDLARDVDHFSDADKNLLKFHGSYQQEDRDARKMRREGGLGKHYLFMVRCKIPGGRVTADQYLALDDLADRYANGTLRVTTRQGFQFHGVLKTNLKATIAGINATLLTTLGACGDVNRNVMSCPAPHRHDNVRDQMQATAARLAAHFAPRSGAYHEIWLDGLRIADCGLQIENQNQPAAEAPTALSSNPQTAIRNPQSEEEPIYGKTYLPRKFKMGLALPDDNCVDVYAQDLGLLAVIERGELVGFNFLVGGGMGMTHGNANTFPHLGRPVCFVPLAGVVEAAEAVVKLFRDHGNRADRKRARIKYLVHDWGVERFREVLSGYAGPLAPPRPAEVTRTDLHHGWHPQGDGKWYYGVSIENGRIKDEGTLRLRSALRALVQRFRPDLRLTPGQDVLLCNLDGAALPAVEAILEQHGVTRPDRLSNVQKYSLACPAIPTCGLAITEAERALPKIIDELESLLRDLGMAQETLSVRMTGCPNGCARPYQSDIGLVGRSGDKYTVFVGGRVRGDRLNFELKDLVPRGEIVATLRPLLARFRDERQGDESFGDYCQRVGAERVRQLVH
jgi:sulfite reductase (ferredoxin)